MMTMTEQLGSLRHPIPGHHALRIRCFYKSVANALAVSSAADDTNDGQEVYTAERARSVLISLSTNPIRDEVLSLNSPSEGPIRC